MDAEVDDEDPVDRSDQCADDQDDDDAERRRQSLIRDEAGAEEAGERDDAGDREIEFSNKEDDREPEGNDREIGVVVEQREEVAACEEKVGLPEAEYEED